MSRRAWQLVRDKSTPFGTASNPGTPNGSFRLASSPLPTGDSFRLASPSSLLSSPALQRNEDEDGGAGGGGAGGGGAGAGGGGEDPTLFNLMLDPNSPDANSEESDWEDDDEEDGRMGNPLEPLEEAPGAEPAAQSEQTPEEDVSLEHQSSASAAPAFQRPTALKSFSLWGKRKFGAGSGSRKTTVRVQVRKKETTELNHLLCAQVLRGAHAGPIWVCEFSRHGLLLATGGKDARVCVWEVLADAGGPSPRSRAGGGAADGQPPPDAAATFNGVQVSGPNVFAPAPRVTLLGHTGDVTSISWSSSLFLVSGSVDKTARVWHVSGPGCLAVFKHPDFVTSVDFHPRDDWLFISGCFDKKLRLWDVPAGLVVKRVQTPALVSAVRFNTEGDLAVAGLVNGHAVFYQLAGGLRYYTQIECRGSKGSRKVTSLRFFRVPGSRKEMLVLTSNDSRVRLYSMDDFSLVCKYRGAANGARLQIGATCSHDGRHIVCGSEDRSVVLWRARNDLVKTIFGRQGRRDMCDTFESFHATANGPVTAACFAPPQVAQAARRPLSVFSSMASVSDLLADAAKEGRNTRQSSLTWAAVQHTEKSLASEGEPDDAGLPGAILVTCGMDGAVAVFENAAL